MDSNRIYGIDLGTTYSCISYVDEHGKPVVVANSEGQSTTPSVVFFESENNIVVGQAAKDVAEMYPERVVSTVKRVMGDPDWFYEHEGNTYHPQDISSFILKKLVNDAQVVTGDEIKDVVITCPAYFGVTEKEATKQAGEIAGLNVHYVIPEPTAAAIAYGIEQLEDQTVLIFDLGGGTFDVSVIDIKGDAIEVICTGGDHKLGGKNWDEIIAGWLAEQFVNEVGGSVDDLTDNPETWQELLNLAEKAKVSLSTRTSCEQQIRHDIERVRVALDREKFDELTNNLLELTLSLTDELLSTAETKGYGNIDKLLLVGGSTYMPQIMEAVQTKYECDIRQFDPNQAVAKGAALFGFKCELDDDFGNIIKGMGNDIEPNSVPDEVRDTVIEKIARDRHMTPIQVKELITKTIANATSKSFGIVMIDTAIDEERVNNLIMIHDSIPKKITRQYATYEENQEGITLICMENTEQVGADDQWLMLDTSTEIGTAELMFTRALPKGSPVEICFSLSEDGLLTVHGKDLTTHQEILAEFKTSAILSSKEVEEKKSRNRGITVT